MALVKRRPIKRVPYKTIITLTSIALVFSSALAIYAAMYADTKIKNGVTVCKINVGSMHRQEAAEMVSARLAEKIGDGVVAIRYKDEKSEINISDKVSFDVGTSVLEAYAVGRSGNLLKRLRSVWGEKADIPLKVQADEELIKAGILSFAERVEKNNKAIAVNAAAKNENID